MLSDKYRPSQCSGMINAKQALEVKQWLAKWTPRMRGQALMVWGPLGTGKTLSINLASKELGYEVVESSAMDERTKLDFTGLIENSRQASIFTRKKVILVEDLEILDSRSLTRLIKESMQPVVLVAENPYELNVPAIMKLCALVKFPKIGPDAMEKFLSNIAAKESMTMGNGAIGSIANASDGDVRCALIDLEICAGMDRYPESRLRTLNVHEIVKKAFRSIVKPDELSGNVLMWISENIQQEFRTPEDVAMAYEYLAKADLFMSRIARRQSWPLQKHVPGMLRGMAIARKGRPSLLANYRAPPWRRSSGTLRKIGQAVHVSAAHSFEYIPIIRNLLDEVSEELGLDDNDREFINSP